MREGGYVTEVDEITGLFGFFDYRIGLFDFRRVINNRNSGTVLSC